MKIVKQEKIPLNYGELLIVFRKAGIALPDDVSFAIVSKYDEAPVVNAASGETLEITWTTEVEL